MALTRVFRRFFLPYQPRELRRYGHGAVVDRQRVLLLVVLPVVVFLLNRVLAALERIRHATDDILAGGVALIGELDGVPEAPGDDRRHRPRDLGRRRPLRGLGREAARLEKETGHASRRMGDADHRRAHHRDNRRSACSG